MENNFSYNGIISTVKEECRRMTEEINKRYPNIEFLVVEENNTDGITADDIAEFYNYNWTGDKDYMHIPNVTQAQENMKRHVTIIAKDTNETGRDSILAVSTVKHNNNNENEIDPCYPKEGPYFELTGVLANIHNKENNLFGLGRIIYQIGVAATRNYNKKYLDGGDTIVVIDCTNKPSYSSLCRAANNEQCTSGIIGFYTVYDKSKRKMVEAPTLVCKVFSDNNDVLFDAEKKHSMYERYNANRKFASSKTSKKLSRILKETIWKNKKSIPFNQDGIITTYFEIDNPIIDYQIEDVGMANKRKR